MIRGLRFRSKQAMAIINPNRLVVKCTLYTLNSVVSSSGFILFCFYLAIVYCIVNNCYVIMNIVINLL